MSDLLSRAAAPWRGVVRGSTDTPCAHAKGDVVPPGGSRGAAGKLLRRGELREAAA